MAIIVPDRFESVDINNEEEFPHPRSDGSKGNCHKCQEDIRGEGYKAKKQKLSNVRKRCQKCGARLCDSHAVLVCTNHVK